jgi:hypothetical protein
MYDDLVLTVTEIEAINSVQHKMQECSRRNGWPQREDGTLIALCHSELSEALEGFRKDLPDDHLPHRPMAEVELADCVIRIMDLCGKKDFRLGDAVAEKHVYNMTRADHKPEARAAAGGKKF